MKKEKLILLVLLTFTVCIFNSNVLAHTKKNMNAVWRTHPFYAGIELGWGDTDWGQLVAKGNTPDELVTLSLSTPIAAGDNGLVYGLMVGYEISTYFALEANYMRFPNTSVTFDALSLYTAEHGVVHMTSSTYVYNFVGKFMVPIDHTQWRGFANAGAALTHRDDPLVNAGHITATFGIGVNYVFRLRYFLEFAFQYYAGYDKATLRPALDYTPFLYTLHMKLGFRF